MTLGWRLGWYKAVTTSWDWQGWEGLSEGLTRPLNGPPSAEAMTATGQASLSEPLWILGTGHSEVHRQILNSNTSKTVRSNTGHTQMSQPRASIQDWAGYTHQLRLGCWATVWLKAIQYWISHAGWRLIQAEGCSSQLKAEASAGQIQATYRLLKASLPGLPEARWRLIHEAVT